MYILEPTTTPSPPASPAGGFLFPWTAPAPFRPPTPEITTDHPPIHVRTQCDDPSGNPPHRETFISIRPEREPRKPTIGADFLHSVEPWTSARVTIPLDTADSSSSSAIFQTIRLNFRSEYLRIVENSFHSEAPITHQFHSNTCCHPGRSRKHQPISSTSPPASGNLPGVSPHQSGLDIRARSPGLWPSVERRAIQAKSSPQVRESIIRHPHPFGACARCVLHGCRPACTISIDLQHLMPQSIALS